MGLFSLVMTTVFMLFELGRRGLASVEVRQGGSNQLAAIRAAFEADLVPTHFYGITVDSTVTVSVHGVAQPRDAMSLVSLSNWDKSGAVSLAGLPRWDRWIVFRVTRQEKGELLRHAVIPKDSQSGRLLLRKADPLSDLAQSPEAFLVGWSGQTMPPQVLARDVRSMKVSLHEDLRAVEVAVTIETQVTPQHPKADVITSTCFVRPKNTVPTD